MSKYTTEVRYLCESLTGQTDSKGFDDVDTIIAAALPYIFSFDFPIFDEEYREVLETKILRHYYTREIGSETYGLWKLRLETKLNEIMPYYNKLYESELLRYDPLRDVDMTTTNVGQKTGEKTDVNNTNDSNERNASNVIDNTRVQTDERTNTFDGSRSTENEDTTASSSHSQSDRNKVDRDLYSDTPQGSLIGVDQENYLTNARKIVGIDSVTGTDDSNGVATSKGKIDDENTETSKGSNTVSDKREETLTGTDSRKTSTVATGKSNSTEDYVMHVFGKSAGASYAKMLKEFRDNLLNIDMDIIRDLADLFMLIW